MSRGLAKDKIGGHINEAVQKKTPKRFIVKIKKTYLA